MNMGWRTGCTRVSDFAFSLKTSVSGAGNFSLLRSFFIVSLLVSTSQIIAQETTSSSATATVTLSTEDEIALTGIHKFKEHLNSLEQPKQNLLWIWITMPDDNGKLRESKVSDEFRKQLYDEDITGAVDTMREWNLEFKFPINDDRVRIGIKENYTAEYLLFRAAMINHLEFARDLIADHDIDPNNSFGTGYLQATTLTVAVENQYGEMVELLLESGADPNFVSKGRDRPLVRAVQNQDTTSTRALIRAGATVMEDVKRPGVDQREFRELVKNDKHEIVNLLLTNGMKLDVFRDISSVLAGPFNALTPLTQALLGKQSEMALTLLPHSDPRIYSKSPVPRSNSGLNDIKLLPRMNALFAAQLHQSELDPTIVQAIEDRIEMLGGSEALALSRLQVAVSKSDLAYYEGDPTLAISNLSTPLIDISLGDVQNSANSDFANSIKTLLTKKHELAIIANTELPKEEQLFANELIDKGEPTDHWHAMLKIIDHATKGASEQMMDDWQQQYAGRETYSWDYSRLNAWINSLDDTAAQKRAFRALDYFEFGLSSGK